jgi:hypothetical protein
MRRQGARLGGHALGLDDRSEPFRVMPVPARDEVPVEIHVICTESRLRHPMAPSWHPDSRRLILRLEACSLTAPPTQTSTPVPEGPGRGAGGPQQLSLT